jgi:hypothetical protein
MAVSPLWGLVLRDKTGAGDFPVKRAFSEALGVDLLRSEYGNRLPGSGISFLSGKRLGAFIQNNFDLWIHTFLLRGSQLPHSKIKNRRVRPNDGTNAKSVVPPELDGLLTKNPRDVAGKKASLTRSGYALDESYTLAL